METTRTRCPIVRAEERTLYQRIEVAGQYQFVSFRKKILWLRESESQIMIRHEGILIDDGSTTSDWYGYLTSVEGAFADIQKMAPKLRITPDDKLTLDIDLRIYEDPVLEPTSPDDIKNNLDPTKMKTWGQTPSRGSAGLWFTSDQRTDPTEEWSPYPVLDRIHFLPRSTVYRTKMGLDRLPEDLRRAIEFQRQAATVLAAEVKL
jgi:hypothetical protein